MYHIYTHLSMLLSEEIRITTHMYIKKRRCDSGAGSASVGRWRDAHDTLRKNIICHNGGASRREIYALSGPWHYVV